jgi:hypothetical protein
LRQPAQALEPGITAIGAGGGGELKLPAGTINWLLSIPYQTGYIGRQQGSFLCASAFSLDQ